MTSPRARERPPPERFVLDDGTVAFLEPSHAVPLVSMVISLRSGSSEDPEGKGGLSRITTRMLRRGCEGMDARQIEDTIDRLGAEMAVDTSPSSVAIHAQVIARNLDPFIELLARVLGKPTFPVDELERLKRESIAEIIEGRDNDRVVAQKALQRTLFAGHPYGRNAGGTTTSVAAIGSDDVRAYYTQTFTRANVVVGLAGDVDRERAPDVARRIVAGLPVGASPASEVPDPAPPSGRKLTFVDKPERTQTQILIGALGTWPRDLDHVPLVVANAVLGGTFTSRLMREVRSKRGWSYGAYSRLSIDRRRQAFSMWTFPAAEDAAKCIALQLDLLEAFVDKGITPREATFAKRYLERSHAFDVDTAQKRLHQALDVELLDLPADYYARWIEHVTAVTPEAASLAAGTRIPKDDLVLVVVGTAKDILEQVKGAVPRLADTSVVPFDAE